MSPFILPHILATSIQMVIVYCVTEIIRPDIYITLKPSTHIKYHTHKHIHSHTSDGIECVCVCVQFVMQLYAVVYKSQLSPATSIYIRIIPCSPRKAGACGFHSSSSSTNKYFSQPKAIHKRNWCCNMYV